MKVVQFTTDNREQQDDYDNPFPHFGAAPEALLSGLAQIPDIDVHVISCVRRKVSAPNPLYGRITYHPVEVPKWGWMSSAYLGCVRATRQLVREINPDIVHGQGTERECAMNAVYSGKPNVVTIHGNMAELNRLGETFKSARLYGILASRLETHSLGRTGGVFCNSAYTESLVAPRAKRTWRVPNAIRGEFFRPRNRQTGSPEVPMILNVGVLGMRKRQLEILRMAAELHTEGYRFQLVFTGAFSTAQEYGQTFASELRKAEKAGYATHAGYLNADSLISLMDEASGFVHFPSEEAFGLVVAEAMARGLKFLGANLGGIKEIATGIPGAELHLSFEELKRGMAAWLDDGAQRVPDAATTIRDKYSPEAVARQHIEIYHDLLNR